MSLKHLAIIMDGNGRWANANGKKRKDGHKAGALKVREITEFCAKRKITHLTLYAFSTENWKRPKIEVDFLMHLLEKYLNDEEESYIKNNICFNTIGDISYLNTKLQERIIYLKEKTKDFSNLTQILALNYGSQDEISRAALLSFKSIIKNLKDNNFQSEPIEDANKIDVLTRLDSLLSKNLLQELIDKNLDTANMPPVDLLLRTGGEKRLSNFLLWQLSYAELFFTDTFWPELSIEELARILDSFDERQRRFGGL
ncbi:di-trans,poly-cis-decaprenylcistransferase [Helicobacter sp. 13S00401-1]|uniref:polyprenyl diphosphate synthase n=1 Tax=Helicobacter sp. 13S00401-1 TaxID=1905758 RepID=UPI000BA55235|nr:polyprenyl diphosphate synthase [Helicobacter sp. 13S00401-1]PAF47878.1 di-trans,poly-cis-decaprenylcistransferase [Helicobacter sp. 13S00401-1]